MNDIHIRAILLMVIAALGIGAAVGVKLVAAPGSIGPAILLLVGLFALAAAIYILMFADTEED